MTPPAGSDLELALAAARAAGAISMRFFGTALHVTHKSPGQPLTRADLEADARIREILLGARPADGWLSEETADSPDRLRRDRVWIVDPIDGTRSFIAGRPEFTISIGLVREGSARVGVVYNPARDEMFWAVEGTGAWLSQAGAAARRLHVSAAVATDARMLASRSEIAAGEFDAFRGVWRIEPVGSTAYKLAQVAAGRAEAFLSRGAKSEWDVCAGVLLVREAGGRATDLAGREPRFNRADPYVHGILATGAAGHDTLLAQIAALPPTQRLGMRAAQHPGLNEENG